MFPKISDIRQTFHEIIHTFFVRVQHFIKRRHKKFFHSTKLDIVRQVLQHFGQLQRNEN